MQHNLSEAARLIVVHPFYPAYLLPFLEPIGRAISRTIGGSEPGCRAHRRDGNLLAILRVLKRQGWGAGRVLAEQDVCQRAPVRRTVPTDPERFERAYEGRRTARFFRCSRGAYGADAAYLAVFHG